MRLAFVFISLRSKVALQARISMALLEISCASVLHGKDRSLDRCAILPWAERATTCPQKWPFCQLVFTTIAEQPRLLIGSFPFALAGIAFPTLYLWINSNCHSVPSTRLVSE